MSSTPSAGASIHVERGDGILDVAHFGRPDDRSSDRGVAVEPRECNLCRLLTATRCDGADHVHHIEVCVGVHLVRERVIG